VRGRRIRSEKEASTVTLARARSLVSSICVRGVRSVCRSVVPGRNPQALSTLPKSVDFCFAAVDPPCFSRTDPN
jgi:hypothetical protein